MKHIFPLSEMNSGQGSGRGMPRSIDLCGEELGVQRPWVHLVQMSAIIFWPVVVFRSSWCLKSQRASARYEPS